MSIKVGSNTETAEQIAQVETGKPGEPQAEAQGEVKEEVSASESEEQSDETLEASESQESEETGSEESAKTDDEESTEKPKKKRGIQKRIAKLNAKLSAAEEEREYWRQEALKTRPTTDDKPSEKKVDAKGRPNEEDFKTHSEYFEALADWKAEQKFSERDQKSKEEQLKKEFESYVNAHKARVETFAKEHEDFLEVVASVDDIPMPSHVQDAIIDSEFGPELMYELSKNPDELERICEMSPLRAAKALGKLEDKIEKAKPKTSEEKVETKTTKAPPPVKPVGSKSGSGVKKTIYSEETSQAEYERLRRERRASA